MKVSRFGPVHPNPEIAIICLLLLILGCQSMFSEALSQGTEAGNSQAQAARPRSLTSDLSALENTFKLNVPINQPISERIGSLEMIVLGAPQAGSFLERLNRIKKAAASENKPPSIDEVQPLLSAPSSHQVSNPLAAKLFQMTELVNESSVNFVRIESFNTNPNQVGDYFDSVMKATKNKIIRFKQMPIPVYITTFSDPAFTNSCVRAFEAWEERAGGLVSFRQVENPDHARIKVIWNHLGLAQNPQDCSLGAHTLTSWRRTSDGIRIVNIGGMPIPLKLNNGTYSVPPQIIEVNLDLIDAKPQETKMRILQNIVAHELGHALGILGHSPNRSDLMYPVTDECSRLSQEDIKTLTRLYREKVDIPL